MESHALLVWQGGALQLEHYYPGHDANSITSTQSMHKSVLALLVGIAIDQGLIKSVDDTAATYIEEWAGDERSKITIRQMLQQASGIDFPGFTGLLQMTMGGDLAQFTFSRGIVGPGGEQLRVQQHQSAGAGHPHPARQRQALQPVPGREPVAAGERGRGQGADRLRAAQASRSPSAASTRRHAAGCASASCTWTAAGWATGRSCRPNG